MPPPPAKSRVQCNARSILKPVLVLVLVRLEMVSVGVLEPFFYPPVPKPADEVFPLSVHLGRLMLTMLCAVHWCILTHTRSSRCSLKFPMGDMYPDDCPHVQTQLAQVWGVASALS